MEKKSFSQGSREQVDAYSQPPDAEPASFQEGYPHVSEVHITVITVVWMDGTNRNYNCVASDFTAGGILSLHTVEGLHVRIPSTNLRSYYTHK